jgi:hypothetical protein
VKAGALLRGIVAAALAAVAIHHVAWIPYTCNRDVKYFATVTGVAEEKGRYGIPDARRNLVALDKLERRCTDDVNIPLILAANAKIAGQKHVAELAYQRALRIDRRPEILLALGLVQLELNKREEGMANLSDAIRFDPTMTEELPEPVAAQLQKN